MVREDGTRWEGRWRDYTTSQQVARRLEVKHGLTQVEGRAYETTERGDRFGERQAAGRAGLASTARDQLAEMVRSAAVGSRSEAEWVRRLRAGGVVVKPYFATGSTDVATGYKAALRPESYDDKLVFYGGGRLGRDLSLPRVRECWAEPSVEDAAAASVEWQAAFRGQPAVDRGGRETGDVSSVNVDRVIGRFARFNDQLAQVPVTDRTGWADAARDVSGTLSAWARLDPGNAGEFRTAAAALSRSAQTRRPGQAPTGGRSGSPTGAALLLLQAARQGEGGKAAVAGVLLLRQILRTAESLRRITPRPRTPRKQPGCNAT